MNERYSFDPLEYVKALWQMLPVIILSLIIGALGGAAYDGLMADHLYAATTKFYVIAGDWATEGRADDYAQVIKSPPVTKAVITRSDLKDENGQHISEDAFLNMVEVSAYDETHIIGITFFDPDPYIACDVANELREESMDAISGIMEPGAIRTVQEAGIPVKLAKPKAMLHSVVGAAAFLVASLIIIFLMMLIEKLKPNRKVKTFRLPYIVVILLFGVFFAIPLFVHEANADRTGPEILFPEGDITYVEGDDYDALLEGVKAEDDIDGDCTEFIRIDDVQVSESGDSCVINYVVKDKSNNVSVVERYASYKEINKETDIKETDITEIMTDTDQN